MIYYNRFHWSRFFILSLVKAPGGSLTQSLDIFCYGFIVTGYCSIFSKRKALCIFDLEKYDKHENESS
jgi:hypothetical protein